MPRVAVISNSRIAGPGRLAPALAAGRCERVDIRLYEGDPLPDPGDVDAIVLLGGEMGAYDESAFPFLIEEKDLIRRAVAGDVPLLGICLGAQLIADALGGRADRAARPEVGLVSLTMTRKGLADDVLGELDDPVLAVHQDTFEIPPGATLLARSPDHPHAFRIGSALALQFHPEADAAAVRRWFEAPSFTLAEAADADTAEVLDLIAAADARLAREASSLFARWLEALRTRSRSS